MNSLVSPAPSLQPASALSNALASPWLQPSPSRMATSTFWKTDMGMLYIPACNALTQATNAQFPWLIWNASRYQVAYSGMQAAFELSDLQGHSTVNASILMGPTAASCPLFIAGVGTTGFLYISVDFKLYSSGPLVNPQPYINFPLSVAINLPQLDANFHTVGLFVTQDYYWVSAQAFLPSTSIPTGQPTLYRASRDLSIDLLAQSENWSTVPLPGMNDGDIVAGIIDEKDSAQNLQNIFYVYNGANNTTNPVSLFRLSENTATRVNVFNFPTIPNNFYPVNRNLRIDAVRLQQTADGGVWLWWNAGNTGSNNMQIRVQGINGVDDWFDPMAIVYPANSGNTPAQAQLIDLLPLSVSNAVAISSEFDAAGKPGQYIMGIGINDQPHIAFPDYVTQDPQGTGKAYQRISTRLYGELIPGIDPNFDDIRSAYPNLTAASANSKLAMLLIMQPDDDCDANAWQTVAEQLAFELQRIAIMRAFWDTYIQDTDLSAQMQMLALSEITTALDVTALVQYLDQNQVEYDLYASDSAAYAGISVGLGTVGATLGSILSALALTTPVGWGIAIGLGIGAGVAAAFSLGNAISASNTANPDTIISDDQHTITLQQSSFTATIAKQFAVQIDLANQNFALSCKSLDTIFIASQQINEGCWQNMNLGTQPIINTQSGSIPASLQTAYDISRTAYLRALCPLVCAKRILTGNSKKDKADKFTVISSTHYPFTTNGTTVTYALVEMADQNGNLRTQDLQQLLFVTYANLVDPQAFFVDSKKQWNIPTTPNWQHS